VTHWDRMKERQENNSSMGIQHNNKTTKQNPLISRAKLDMTWYDMPTSRAQNNGGVDKNHWRNRGLNRIEFFDFLHKVFGLTDKDLLPQIFAQFDTNKSGQIEDLEWVECLAILLRGNLDDKIAYAFSVYDTNGDGYIARDEMQGMLKSCIARPSNEDDVDEAVKDIVEIVLKLMDKDHDFKVSKQDFRQSVQEEPLLLEAFGPVLPDDGKIEAFQNDIFAEVIDTQCYIDRKERKSHIKGPTYDRNSTSRAVSVRSDKENRNFKWSLGMFDLR